MPNLLNMFWGLFAFIFGFVLVYVLVPIITLMTNAFTVAGSPMNLTIQIASWLMAVVFLFVIPAITVMSDEDDNIFRQMIKSTKGK